MIMQPPEPMDTTSVSLRFFGDDLDPETITAKLGASPTSARRKGEVKRVEEVEHVAETGSWLLSSERTPNGSLETQILSLFDKLTDDLEVWRELTSTYRSDLFCGLWSEAWNRSFQLSAEVVEAMSKRGLALGFDLYFVEK
jgi:hypothetical protein